MIAVIQYGAGNIGSVLHALRRFDQEYILTADPATIQAADKVILPGVGQADAAMRRLQESGIAALLPALTQPVLGICLGLQLMCRYSEEGDVPCLGLINTNVRRFPPDHIVPHMGWNNIAQCRGAMLEGLDAEVSDMYFVHSYYAELCAETTSVCNYILPFSATLQRGNFYATQFHPEKSGAAGERLLRNFLAL
jgi:glutamine amidotransferase